MKYILLTAAMLALCISLGLLVTFLISRKKKLSLRARVLLTAAVGISAAVLTAVVYLNDSYPADPDAQAAMQGSPGVSVTKTDEGWLFDGSGTGSALIFYPGAKVEAQAYAPLMSELAAGGLDCFLVDMPMNMSIFGINKAKGIIERSSYEHWYIAGHSMGGTAAASYCASDPDRIDGLILLASYSAKKIGSGIRVLSVYGTEDKILDRDDYADNRKLLPEDMTELIIEGGNHAQFGCYGEQKGDGKASISPEEQRRLTKDAILRFTALK